MGSLTPLPVPRLELELERCRWRQVQCVTRVSHKFNLQPAHINLDGEFWIQIYTKIKRSDLLL